MSKELAANTTLSHYRIVSKLGAGGLGEVYRARDTRLDRQVAIKLLFDEFNKDPDRLHRFVQEARAASALNHPNIITIHDIGQENDVYFIAMELIDGRTLRQRLAEGSIPLREAVEIAQQATAALAAAHAAGIVHRDIKPENIMVRADGYVKVLDFGLAKLVSTPTQAVDSVAATLTKHSTEIGMVLGTLRYMSPEQARGQRVDSRSDIFSLGVVLYEMLAGKSPFAGETIADVIAAILDRAPMPVTHYRPEVPRELEQIVSKTLRKDREQRYQSVADLHDELKNLMTELEITGRSIEQKASGPSGAQDDPTLSMTTPTSFHPRWSAVESLKLSRRTSPRPAWAWAALAVTLVLMAALGYVSFHPGTTTGSRQPIRSLAVLPLENLSGDAAQEYFADGMTEALISNLTQVSALRVISRTSVMRFKGSHKSLQEIAQELGVDAVIEGSVQRSGERVKITVRLIPVVDESPLWSRDYERELADVLKLQSEVAQTVADEIQVQVTAEERGRLASARSVNPEAHVAYLLGSYYLKRRNEEDLKIAIGHFERATKLDPNYAAAWAGLSFGWLERGIWGRRSLREVEQFARTAALKAIELDDSCAEAHTSLGQVKKVYDWDWSGSEEEFARAIALEPGNVAAHTFFADLLMALGRHSEAINEIQTAAQLDPLSPGVQSIFGRVLYRARKFPEAERQLRRALELESRDYGTYGRLADVYEQMERYTEAIENLKKAEELQGGSGNGRGYPARLARVYARMGRRDEARRLLNDLQRTTGVAEFPKVFAAGAWAALDDKNQAFKLLSSAVEGRSDLVIFIKEDPPFESLHSDPRWNELVGKLNFPQKKSGKE